MRLLAIINKYTATVKSSVHCSHTILKHLDYCSRDEAVASLMFELYILNASNGFFYYKYPFDTGIQVWFGGGVGEALATKLLLTEPEFLPIRHG